MTKNYYYIDKGGITYINKHKFMYGMWHYNLPLMPFKYGWDTVPRILKHAAELHYEVKFI